MNELNNFVEPNKALYELILDGIVLTDLAGKIEYVNEAACGLMICDKASAMKGKYISQCFNDSTYLDEIIKHLATKKTYVTTKVCTKIDGREISFILCFSLLLDNNSLPIGLQVVFKNPNSGPDENLYFEKHSALLKSLNYHSREIIYISDLINKRNVFCSQAVEKILGWTPKDFLDGGWAFAISLTHPDEAEMNSQKFIYELELRSKEKFVHDNVPIIFEFRKRHKDGSWVNVHSECLLLERDKDQNPKYLMTFSRVIPDEDKKSVPEIEELETSIKSELDKILLLNIFTGPPLLPKIAK